MASDISICSQALVMLGAKSISSFNDATDSARMCQVLYPDARKQVMRSHPWNCLVKRAQLAPESTMPLFGYKNQFVLPAACLRLLNVGSEDETPDEDYQLEGERRVLYDGTVLNVRYIEDKPESRWDDLLAGVMTAYMAMVLAYPITKSGTQQEAQAALYQQKFKAAKAVDGQENPPEQITDSPLLSARLRGQVFAGGGVY